VNVVDDAMMYFLRAFTCGCGRSIHAERMVEP
jgi:hypothetical protein